jgi:uncharacterized protein (TIGR02466 family)
MTDTPQDIFAPFAYFPTTIYTIKKPEFLETVSSVSKEALSAAKEHHEMNQTYPVVMSVGMMGDTRIADFETFIAQAGWTVLDNQGYDMSLFNTYVSELWCQEHFKFSGMEQHVHPYGVYLSGFYFLDTPENGPVIEIHDPRPGKVQASLPYKQTTDVSEAHNSLYIKPEPGLMVISNSWLPHSFTRNSSDEPARFIHFNISIMPAQQEQQPIVV